jgi:uncharacterized protein YodC (DUF2158 family)
MIDIPYAPWPFDFGDVVYLKSGSPPLTVMAPPAKNGADSVTVQVAWYTEGDIDYAEFDTRCLTITEPKF